MSLISKTQDELQDFEVARNLTITLREISAVRLQDTKEEFKLGRSYYKEVEDLYRLIKLYSLKEKNPSIEKALKDKPKDSVFVAVTSNKRFYGSLNNDVMKVFLTHLEKEKKGDFFVIGKTGKQFLKGTKYENRCTYFEFQKDSPSVNETVVFIDTTRRYGQVFMFYPQFVNVFRQKITVTDITYIPETTSKVAQEKKDNVGYIFEPDVGELFWFFDTQVRYILFNQVMREIELSRMSARLLRMNIAEENARNAIRATSLKLIRAKASLANMRLLETFAGISQWKKKNI
jgi:ATP synthase F1 gamma subunit